MTAIKFFLLLVLLPASVFAQKFSYLGYELGMDEAALMRLSKNHPDLYMEKDLLLVQLIPNTPFTIGMIGKDQNIKKVFIDTYQKQSYQITVFLNPLYFSFYTLSEALMDKYGVPAARSSFKVTWYDTEQTKRLTLEYPSTVKITDTAVLQQVAEAQKSDIEKAAGESVDYKNRQRLIDEL